MALLASLREHAALAIIVLGYVLVTLVFSRWVELPYSFSLSLAGYAVALFIPLVFGFCWHVISVMVFVRPDRLTLYLIASLKPYLAPQRLLFAAPVLLLIPAFASAFTFFKSTIPAINPYAWDAQLIYWDAWLHGGVHPWVWLQPLLGYPVVTGAVNFLYNLWFFIMYALLTLQAFDTRNPALRMRFLLSFVLSWIVLGTLGAIYFSSMGPCYDALITGQASPFAALMDYLKSANQQVPVWALNVQKILWDNYQNNQPGIGSGISAMPSMHVATATLMALFGWQYSRSAGIALTVYAVVILIGSVHLGWHYALDGYVGALGAWVVWWLVGRWQAAPHHAPVAKKQTP